MTLESLKDHEHTVRYFTALTDFETLAAFLILFARAALYFKKKAQTAKDSSNLPQK